MPADRGRRMGFTLLEVMAAVAVMGLVYSVLATAAIQGLRAEGDAGRRLRASLLADQRITEIEAQVALGQTPEIGETENEEDEFIVRTEVRPLDLPIAESKASKKAQDRLERAVGAKASGTGQELSLLTPTGASKQSMLRQIDLSVSWPDGEAEQSVWRTTFGIDAAAAAPLIEQLVAAAEAAKANETQQDASKTQAQRKGEQALEGGAAGTSNGQRLRAVPPSGTDPNDAAGADE